jgi:hypothetical protein
VAARVPGLDGLVGIGVSTGLVLNLGVPGRLREGLDNGDGRERAGERGEALGELRGDGRGEMGLRVLISKRRC